MLQNATIKKEFIRCGKENCLYCPMNHIVMLIGKTKQMIKRDYGKNTWYNRS